MWEKDRYTKDSKIFGLNSWKYGVLIIWDRKKEERASFDEKSKCLGLGIRDLLFPLGIKIEPLSRRLRYDSGDQGEV